MNIIKTAGGKSTVYCGEGCFLTQIQNLIKGKQVFIITDSNVNRIYGDLISSTFKKNADFVFKAGEKSKNHKTLIAILEKMVQSNLTRSSIVVAFGGGVVGDIAGLAASLYMRGVRLIQVPTTLLSQVDSSVGGKTAVDFMGCKNIIGAFYQPETVLIDSTFLQTLPKREIRCGLGEIIKYAALNGEIYDEVIKNKEKLFTKQFFQIITPLCVQFKAEVVNKDEKETSGVRKCLNLGHTTGHAFELFYKRKSHGEFVLIGMLYELYISARYGIVGGQYKNSLINLIKKVIKIPKFENVKESAKFALHDKKNKTYNEVSVILPKSKGEYQEVFIPVEEYLNLVEECANVISYPEKKFAVIGKDVSLSSSPEMHKFIAENMGFKISYEKISIPEEKFEEQIDKILQTFDGINVTIPYKLAIIPHLKGVYDDAQTFGAVNTVNCKNLSGYNTDGLGFMLMLENEGVQVKGKKVLILGAGGAGRSVAKKLIDAGATVYVYDRNSQNSTNLNIEFSAITPLFQVETKPYNIIVNATGVGMHKTVGVSPVEEEILNLCSVAVDLIYVPEKSKFLQIAESLNKKIINGRAMLFYQAYFAECIYFGIKSNSMQAKKLYEEYLKEIKL